MKAYSKYLLLIFSFAGCREKNVPIKEQNQPLFSEPLIVSLDTIQGYRLNPITGDSIKPMINSVGDTIRTGIATILKPITVDSSKIEPPRKIKKGRLHSVAVSNNIHILPEKLKTFSAEITEFQSKQTEQGSTIQIIPNSERVLTMSLPDSIKEDIKPLKEPQPVKALVMRFKDAGTANIQYLDVGQGLNYSYIRSIVEDRKGNLWFGLDGNGLCKYDGVHITTYTQNEGLPDNNITSLMVDEKDNIWISTQTGISVFDGNKFTGYLDNQEILDSRIYSIIIDKNQNTWLMSETKGITRTDGKKCINYSLTKGANNNSEIVFPADKNGNIWIGSSSGISRFDGSKVKYYNLHADLFGKAVYTILCDSKGNTWFGTYEKGLVKFDGKSFTQFTMKEGLPDNSIITLLEDKKGSIWIGTRYGGIAKYNGTAFITYSQEQGLSNNKISCITEDRQGNIWIGTEGGGINKLNDGMFFQTIDMEYFANSRVRPIIKDNQGNLWFGTEVGGIFKYDGQSVTDYSLSTSTTMDGMRSMLADKEGNIWFGKTGWNGLYKYNGKDFFQYHFQQGSLSKIFSILEDKQRSIWIGTFGDGFIRMNEKQKVFYNEKNGFPTNKIYNILQDKKGNLWFGTENGGVVKYAGSRFVVYSEKEGLFSKRITSIEEDHNGNLWFGTLGSGLCKFDGITFLYYTEKQGLSYNDVWSVKEDSIGKIWVGTDKGLSVLIPQKGDFDKINNNYFVYSFSLQDGLKATDFNLHSVCIDDKNQIWWGTGKALINYDLNSNLNVATPRSLSLNYIEINGQFEDFRNLPDSINNKNRFRPPAPFSNYPMEMKLSYNEDHLKFHFSAIEWNAPDKIKYSYRLIGSDAGWSNLSHEAEAEFTNLQHGNYIFQVKAIGQSQEWTEPVSYSFTIQPAWWQTWWFKVAVISISVLSLLYITRLIYLVRLHKQKIILEKQLAVQYERQRISAEMHDDVAVAFRV